MEWRVCPLTELFGRKESTKSLSLFDIAPVWQHLERGAESFELLLPVE